MMPPETIEARELESLTREYADLVRAFRLDHFRARLARGHPAAVLRNRCGFAGDRWTIWFRDGSALRLWLYERVRVDVTEMLSLRWVHDVWRAEVRAIGGDVVSLLAHRVELHPAR